MYRNTAVAGTLAMAALLAQAQVALTFNVSTTVLPTCSFASAPLNVAFGNYDPSTTYLRTASARVSCNGNPVSLFVWISTPGNQRRMSGPGGDFLNYELYTDINRTTRFPSVAPSAPNYTYTGSPLSIVYAGELPALQYATPGAYAQTATFNVQF